MRTLARRIWQIKGIDLPHTVVIDGVATISRLHKIQGSFAKEPYIRDYILRKRPIILWSLPIVATPYGGEAMSRLL